jgi:hypothetical protein
MCDLTSEEKSFTTGTMSSNHHNHKHCAVSYSDIMDALSDPNSIRVVEESSTSSTRGFDTHKTVTIGKTSAGVLVRVTHTLGPHDSLVILDATTHVSQEARDFYESQRCLSHKTNVPQQSQQ